MKTEKVYKRPANVRKSIWDNASEQTRDIMFYAGMSERFKKQLRTVKKESEPEKPKPIYDLEEQARRQAALNQANDRQNSLYAPLFNDPLFRALRD